MTNFLKMIGVVFLLIGATACASTGGYDGPSTTTNSSNLQSDSHCKAIGGANFQVAGFEYNPNGASGAVHTGLLVMPADDDCTPVEDAQGKPLITLATAGQSSDIRKDAINGGIGILKAGANGALAAEIMSDGQCSGSNCGGAPVVVNAQAISSAGAEAGANLSGGCGSACAPMD